MGGYYGGYGNPQPPQDRTLELIMRRGEIAAEGAQRSGQIWGNVASGLGQIGTQAVQQYQEQKQVKAQAAKTATRDAAWVSYVQQGDWAKDPEEAYKTTMSIWGPQEGPKQFQALNGAMTLMHPKVDHEADGHAAADIIDAYKPLGDPARSQIYAQTVDLIKNKYPKVELPAEYDPKTWAERIEPLVPALRGAKPAEEKMVNTVGPDGQPVQKLASAEELRKGVPMVPPKAEKGPAIGSLEDYSVQKFGPRPTAAQMLQARKEYGQADDRPLRVTGGDKDHERMVSAVIANPSLWNDLTPSEKGKLAADLNAQGFNAFGKPMTDAAIKQVSETKGAIESLNDLKTTLKENEQYIGPIAGLQALNPYSDARKAQAKLDLVRQRVGKSLEGGVLRKEDEEKYKKILATLRDEPETAIYKVDNLISTLQRDMETFQREQVSAGRRPSQYAPKEAPPPDLPGAPRIGYRRNGYHYVGGPVDSRNSWVKD